MSTTLLMTFAEFARLPDPDAGKMELICGEVITMAPPKHTHTVVARRIQRILGSRR